MQLQPSVIIWTAICFLLFMLVIDRLLLRPVLKHMDERREKIDSVKRRREALERELEDERLEKRLETQARLSAAQTAADEEYARVKLECEEELKALDVRLQSEAEAASEGYGDRMERDREAVKQALDSMAKEYAEKLISTK